jgi:hypothetical protein
MPPSLHTWGEGELDFTLLRTFWYTYISKDTLRNAVPPNVPMCAPSRPRGLSLCSPGQHESQKIRPPWLPRLLDEKRWTAPSGTIATWYRYGVPVQRGTIGGRPPQLSSWAVPESPAQGFGAYRNMYARDGVSVRRRNRMSLGFLAVS